LVINIQVLEKTWNYMTNWITSSCSKRRTAI